MEPAGLLVLSTPDETSYPGRWSGYAPHVGVVSPRQLHGLLADATGTTPHVHRLDGGPFRMPLARRVAERVVNTTWTAVQRAAPRVAGSLAARGGRETPWELDQVLPAATPFRLVDPRHGTGTGLLAVVRRSA